MAETIQRGCDGQAKWHWYDVEEDLRFQGGLDGVVIWKVYAHGCGGKTQKDTRFYITWMHDRFLLLSMSQEDQELVDAFAKVVEYRPFCRYINEYGLLTFEWDKKDPDGRFIELQNDGKTTELQAIQ